MNYFRWFAHFISESFQNIRSNLATSLVTIATIAISLAICGLFLGFFINLNNILSSIGKRIQVVAYLKDDLPQDTILNIRKEIAGMPEVEDSEYLSKEKAFSIFKEELKGQKGILDGLGINPFPASLEIRVKGLFRNPQGVKGLTSRLKMIGGIEDVQYGQEWVERFFVFIKFVEGFALIIGSFLLVATVFIVSNTIRLTLYSRREEIEILGLIGATNIFIKAPFFIEAILEGFLGAVISIGLLYMGRYFLMLKTPSAFAQFVDLPVFTIYFTSGLIATGVILGILGSSISLKKLAIR
ncbi:MAG: ABC transporter permease [Deltaproteobacteria bacterium]|nr:ABC transporter permease [Deltaproteobacteria bacterium]